MRAILSGLIIVSVCVATPALARNSIICTERNGGWCESDGNCYPNTKSPAEYRFETKLIPGFGQASEALLRECRMSICGLSWTYELSTNGSDDVIARHKYGVDTFQIHRKTGFFTNVSYMSGDSLGRVSHAFGTCTFN